MPGLVPPHRPSATPRCPQTRLPVVGTHAAPLPLGLWQPGLGTGCSRDFTPMPRTIRTSCRLEAGRERASWERRVITACPGDGVAALAVPAIARGPPVAAIVRGQRLAAGDPPRPSRLGSPPERAGLRVSMRTARGLLSLPDE